ncbi:hypothetical protein Kfla_4127 [Kribbella flavida DSM 17836]|uniref:Uncharacterized protein n=1 Tax=Kribbella flavida (strain DSM 17836 / JCM 10339 / NBRC 14399) TaxID=479435 RepID=D2PSN6_KRIFD|nr:hypothetical protein [Kribbella flavida]ADB33174.1 hypothetical protein Kfla_4127 [Kribbella flavida DSM 17836]
MLQHSNEAPLSMVAVRPYSGPVTVGPDSVTEPPPESPHVGCRPVDLAPHRNNVGSTPASGTRNGAFNIWGNSFPAEELPPPGLCAVDQVVYDFPPTEPGTADNVRAAGQFVEVPAGRYDWLYVLGAAERRVEDELAFHFADGAVDFEQLRLSDFWAAPAWFGETQVRATRSMHYPFHVQAGVPAMLWSQRVPVTRRSVLSAVRLPRNPAVHLFAATLVLSGGEQR